MVAVIYRCPQTGFNIQGWFADDIAEKVNERTYLSTECTLCALVHFVNPPTGKVAVVAVRTLPARVMVQPGPKALTNVASAGNVSWTTTWLAV